MNAKENQGIPAKSVLISSWDAPPAHKDSPGDGNAQPVVRLFGGTLLLLREQKPETRKKLAGFGPLAGAYRKNGVDGFLAEKMENRRRSVIGRSDYRFIRRSGSLSIWKSIPMRTKKWKSEEIELREVEVRQ